MLSGCRLTEVQKNQYTEDLETVGSRGLLNAELPLVVNLLARLPFGFATSARAAAMRIAKYGMQSLERYKKQLDVDPENVKPTLLTNAYRLVEDGVVPKEQLLRDGELQSLFLGRSACVSNWRSAMGNIVAGTDTTSVTTTYLMWSLARHPSIQAQVIAEVEKLPLDCTDEDIRKVDLFAQIMNETLRLYGAASGSMPRDVPAGGITVCGHYIPSGTTISTQSYSLHRIPDVWANVNDFDPSRWKAPTKEMKDAFMPFGGGSRGKT